MKKGATYENEEETVYQYYTIVASDTSISNLDDGDLAYIESVESPEKVMYLSLKQEEEAYAPEVVLDGANDTTEDEDSAAVANIELIAMEDGQMYMTDSTELDENFTTADPMISCDSADISGMQDDDIVRNDLTTSDNESDYRKIKLEDGSCAYIDKSLWHSLIENIDETEDEQTLAAVKKEKRFRCDYFGCNKVYSTAHHLTVHVRNHTGSRPYQCNVTGCEKGFATGYSLKAHLRTHTGEAPYSCGVCPKQFKTSGDLQKHVRTHTGEKPFKCPIDGCGRSFTTSNIRKVHIRSHTGERPYACTYTDCGKAFASATNFKNHMRIHSGEKPYQCSVPGCEKRFTEYSSLFKHSAVHKPFTPLQCEYCDQVCKHETTLKAHKQATHKILITPDGTEIRLTKEKSGNYFMSTNVQ